MFFNTEFKALIPPLSNEKHQQLEANIIADGCRDPLVLWNGTLIDGHNRYEICTRLNIPFQTFDMDFASENDVKIWIITNQLGRRNITSFTRAELALQLKPALVEQARENLKTSTGGTNPQPLQNSANPVNPIDTRQELAKTANVSHDTITKTEKILSNGIPELVSLARSGEISINATHQAAQLTEEKQQAIVDEIKQGVKPVDAVKNHVHVSKNSGENEWYTPKQFVDTYHHPRRQDS